MTGFESISVMQLIRDAYFTIGMLNPQTPLTSFQEKQGLNLLNCEIQSMNGSGMNIPYFSEYTFNMVGGKQQYTFGRLNTCDEQTNRFVSIDYIDYILNTVQYWVKVDSTKEWKTPYRQVANLNPSPPNECFVDQQRDQTVINFYYPPDQAYSCTIRGKQVLDEFTPNTQALNVPPYFYKLFKYILAAELSRTYPGPSVWTDAHQKQLDKLLMDVRAQNTVNVDIEPNMAMLGRTSYGNYLSPIFVGY